MSGTSLDGEVDVALIETDGRDLVRPLGFYAHLYDPSVQDQVRACFGAREPSAQTREAEALITQVHVDAVRESGFTGDVIGFHGQTITHDPGAGFTWQLGDGAALSRETGMEVINDFRSADMRAGGQGAPLAPLYHRARVRMHELGRPVAFLNIGGVANVTFINSPDGELRSKVPASAGTANSFGILAFDTGPGNALMDDYVRMKTGQAYDADGAMAAGGQARKELVEAWLGHEYFQKAPPKSLDRNEWSVLSDGVIAQDLENLGAEDALASLMEFTVRSIEKADALIGGGADWYACGGGRHNTALMRRLGEVLSSGIQPVEALGWNGDAVEAECFAYLAVRSLLGLPISLPEVTGVSAPQTGGVLHKKLRQAG